MTVRKATEAWVKEWDFIRENLQKVADCGFRIYEHDDYGIYLGIDGGGYDFYEAHWIPLYKAAGCNGMTKRRSRRCRREVTID